MFLWSLWQKHWHAKEYLHLYTVLLCERKYLYKQLQYWIKLRGSQLFKDWVLLFFSSIIWWVEQRKMSTTLFKLWGLSIFQMDWWQEKCYKTLFPDESVWWLRWWGRVNNYVFLIINIWWLIRNVTHTTVILGAWNLKKVFVPSILTMTIIIFIGLVKDFQHPTIPHQ